MDEAPHKRFIRSRDEWEVFRPATDEDPEDILGSVQTETLANMLIAGITSCRFRFSDSGIPILPVQDKLGGLLTCLVNEHKEDALGHLFDLLNFVAPGYRYEADTATFANIQELAAHYGANPTPLLTRQQPTKLFPVINATAYSDDNVYTVTFSASGYFEQATEEEILRIVEEQWSHGYACDEVALYEELYHSDLFNLFRYIEFHNHGLTENIGFECVIDETSAKAWLAEHRPQLLQKIQEMEDGSQED